MGADADKRVIFELKEGTMGLIQQTERLSWPCVIAGIALIGGAVLFHFVDSALFLKSSFSSMHNMVRSIDRVLATAAFGIGLFALCIGMAGLAFTKLKNRTRYRASKIPHSRYDETEENWIFL